MKSTAAYWTAILLSSIIFGIGHLPAVCAAVDTVDFTLQAYIIICYSLGGCFLRLALLEKRSGKCHDCSCFHPCGNVPVYVNA
ncbi:MAG: type II CAAX prenyl endopeptidase Rce1 family protein [Flavobacteriales bacterium]